MNSFMLPAGLQSSISSGGLLAKCKRIALLMVLLQCMCTLAFSQSTVVRGKIVNESNQPIAGATVQLKNSTTGTSSDAAGNFALTVPAGTSTLVFSYVGYTPRELPVTGNEMSVQLQPIDNSLGEVVVVG